jgi:SAM-dependent methyltransferase
MSTPSDKVYRDQRESIGDFRFDKSVATVFDDMVSRSVPFYGEIQRMVVEIAADYAEPGSSVYDLGCSSGTTLVALNPQIDKSVRFVGVDNSSAMLDKCREKFAAEKFERPVDLVIAELNDGVQIENASVVMLVLTLQFIRPLRREKLIADIYRACGPTPADRRREGAGRGLSVQPRSSLLLRHEAAARLQRDGDQPEARGARERADSLQAAGEPGAAVEHGLQGGRRVLQVVQLRRHCRDQVMVTIGNFLFRFRNGLFPLSLLLMLLPGRPLFWTRWWRWPWALALRCSASWCVAPRSASSTSSVAGATSAYTPRTW